MVRQLHRQVISRRLSTRGTVKPQLDPMPSTNPALKLLFPHFPRSSHERSPTFHRGKLSAHSLKENGTFCLTRLPPFLLLTPCCSGKRTSTVRIGNIAHRMQSLQCPFSFVSCNYTVHTSVFVIGTCFRDPLRHSSLAELGSEWSLAWGQPTEGIQVESRESREEVTPHGTRWATHKSETKSTFDTS